MKTVVIDNNSYNVAYTLKACMIQEKITGEIFSLNSLTKQYIFYYAMLLANNKEVPFSFDEFLVYAEDSNISAVFVEVVNSYLDKQKLLSSSEQAPATATEDKKKA